MSYLNMTSRRKTRIKKEKIYKELIKRNKIYRNSIIINRGKKVQLVKPFITNTFIHLWQIKPRSRYELCSLAMIEDLEELVDWLNNEKGINKISEKAYHKLQDNIKKFYEKSYDYNFIRDNSNKINLRKIIVYRIRTKYYRHIHTIKIRRKLKEVPLLNREFESFYRKDRDLWKTKRYLILDKYNNGRQHKKYKRGGRMLYCIICGTEIKSGALCTSCKREAMGEIRKHDAEQEKVAERARKAKEEYEKENKK